MQNLFAHYESQSDAEAIAADEAALEDPNQAVMLVPRGLVPAVRRLLAKTVPDSSPISSTSIRELADLEIAREGAGI